MVQRVHWPLCAEGYAFASKGCGFAASPTTKNPVPSHPLCPMSSVSAWSTAAAVPKYDGARQA